MEGQRLRGLRGKVTSMIREKSEEPEGSVDERPAAHQGAMVVGRGLLEGAGSEGAEGVWARCGQVTGLKVSVLANGALPTVMRLCRGC